MWPHVTTILTGYVKLWVEAPNRKSPTTLPCLVAIGLVQVEIWNNLSRELTKTIEESRNFMSESTILYVTTLPNLVAIDIVEVEICF